MMKLGRARIAPMATPLLALSLSAGLLFAAAPAAAQDGVRALSPSDRLSYTTAFDALRRGDLDAARAAARAAQDHVLMGRVEFERLFHAGHVATFEELAAWLEDYADLPDAPRAYDLAMRRRPDGAPEPRRPDGGARWRSAADTEAPASDPSKAARVLLNADDLTGAYDTGARIGDWWTAGLAAWRLERFNDAFLAFQRVAEDPMEDAWIRAGAAFWTARSAASSGRLELVNPYLRLAARWPATFYGQVALERLGETPVVIGAGGARPYLSEPGVQTLAFSRIEPAALEAFVREDPRARRAVAYHELGRRADFEAEARIGLRAAETEEARLLWVAVIEAVGYTGTASDRQALSIDARHYAMPELRPDGGFVIERALVLAIARKESGFNASAVSYAGAYGMMQVMPGTAAELSGDRDFTRRPRRLLEPGINLRLGQAYVTRMMARPEFSGDILRAVASYNAGPGPMLNALRRLGPNPDPFLLIETIDVPQARDYVEKVVAAYWIYQRMMGRPVRTLQALAAGETHIPLALDWVPPPPEAAQTAAATSGAAQESAAQESAEPLRF